MPSIQDLEEAFRQAQAATEAYSAEVTAKYRAEFPDPADWTGPGPDPDTAVTRAKAWTDEEREHLNGLRQEATRLALELHRARDAAKTDGSAE